MKSLHCLYTRFICLHVYFSIPAESHFSSQAQEERISVHFLCYMYEKDTLPFHKGYRKFHFKSWSWSMPQIPHLPLSNTSVIYACFSWGAMGWNIAWLQCVLYSAQMPVMKDIKKCLITSGVVVDFLCISPDLNCTMQCGYFVLSLSLSLC